MKSIDDILEKWKAAHAKLPYQTITLDGIFKDLEHVCTEYAKMKDALADSDTQNVKIAKLERVVSQVVSTHKWRGYPSRAQWQIIMDLAKEASK